MTMPSPVRVGGVCDQDLLGGFAIGDANAGAAFVERFQGRVYGMAINLIGDRGLAEDVSRKAFVRAWRRADTYDPSAAPSPPGSCASPAIWPSTPCAVGRNARSRDGRGRRPRQPRHHNWGRHRRIRPDPQTRTALTRLPSSQFKALCLAAFYGYTAQEIAASEGISVGTAKTRIREGLRTLRAELTPPDAG